MQMIVDVLGHMTLSLTKPRTYPNTVLSSCEDWPCPHWTKMSSHFYTHTLRGAVQMDLHDLMLGLDSGSGPSVALKV